MDFITIYLILPACICLGMVEFITHVTLFMKSLGTISKKVKVFIFFVEFCVCMFLTFFLLNFQKSCIESKYIKDTEVTDTIQSDTTPTIQNIVKNHFVTHVTLTSYNPVVEQCDSDPLVTADGTRIDLEKLKRKEIRYCAVSRNLLPYLPYGSIIHVEGHGLYEVRDTMNKRYAHCIDILQHVGEKNFKKTKVRIVKVA